MKNIIHQSTGKLIMGATLLLAIGGSFVNAETVMLEFRVANDNVANAAVAAAGFLPVYHAGYLYSGTGSADKHNYAQTYPVDLVENLNASVGELTITITGNNAFGGHVWQGGVTQPEDPALYVGSSIFMGEGFYFNTTDVPFTIAGFNEGDQISVYALYAGNNSAQSARVTIGSETNHAAAVDYNWGSTESPTIDNFTLINTIPFTVGADRSLTGSFSNNSTGVEGRISGMILVVTPIPEPSTWALIVTGVVLLAVLRLRSIGGQDGAAAQTNLAQSRRAAEPRS
jgi:hypothetical protein